MSCPGQELLDLSNQNKIEQMKKLGLMFPAKNFHIKSGFTQVNLC